jgi:L-cysteine desulfidase
MKKYVIFSPTEGFYLTDFGWSYSPDEADTFSEEEVLKAASNPGFLPGSDGQDVLLVPKADYSHVEFDDMIDKLIMALTQFDDGDDIALLMNKHMDAEIIYIEDEQLALDGKTVSLEDALSLFRDIINELERDVIAGVYESIQKNKAWPDDYDGFYHQRVA